MIVGLGGLLLLVAAGIVGLLVLLVVWAIGLYNRFVSLRNIVQNAWSQIAVQLKRRHDLIPDLVEMVKGGMTGERGILEDVIKARASAVSAQTPAASAQAEGFLTQALGKLFALVESYPQLQSIGNVSQLMEDERTTENRIAFARQHYNDSATGYNIAIQRFPGLVVARLFAFEPAELFEMDVADRKMTAEQAANPKVDLKLS